MVGTYWPDAGATPPDAVTDVQYETLRLGDTYDGLVGGLPSDSKPVYGDASGRQVKIRAGKSYILRGFAWSSGSTDTVVPISANASGSTRIDVVALQLNRSDWSVDVVVVAGTPGSGAPAVTRSTGTTGVYQQPLAEVTVINGASTINAADVINRAWWLDPDGTILCNGATRTASAPPPSAGRWMFEVDRSRLWVGVSSSSWKPVLEDSGWINCTINTAGWKVISASTEVPKIRRYNGMIQVRGGSLQRISGLNTANDSQLFSWPSAFSPDTTHRNSGDTHNSGTGSNSVSAIVCYPNGDSSGFGNSCMLLDHVTLGAGDIAHIPDFSWSPATDAYWS